MLGFLGLGQSFVKYLSLQPKHLLCGLDLWMYNLQSTMLCDLELHIEDHLGDISLVVLISFIE